jgi:hypothetical protein
MERKFSVDLKINTINELTRCFRNSCTNLVEKRAITVLEQRGSVHLPLTHTTLANSTPARVTCVQKKNGHVLAVKCHLLSMYEQNQSKTLVSLNELHIQFTLKSYKELGGQLKGRPASPQVFLNARYFTS